MYSCVQIKTTPQSRTSRDSSTDFAAGECQTRVAGWVCTYPPAALLVNKSAQKDGGVVLDSTDALVCTSQDDYPLICRRVIIVRYLPPGRLNEPPPEEPYTVLLMVMV